MLATAGHLHARKRDLGTNCGRKGVDVPVLHAPPEELPFLGEQNAAARMGWGGGGSQDKVDGGGGLETKGRQAGSQRCYSIKIVLILIQGHEMRRRDP